MCMCPGSAAARSKLGSSWFCPHPLSEQDIPTVAAVWRLLLVLPERLQKLLNPSHQRSSPHCQARPRATDAVFLNGHRCMTVRCRLGSGCRQRLDGTRPILARSLSGKRTAYFHARQACHCTYRCNRPDTDSDGTHRDKPPICPEAAYWEALSTGCWAFKLGRVIECIAAPQSPRR